MRSRILFAAMAALAGLAALVVLWAASAAAAPAAGWLPADPAHRWSFPADHRAHPGVRNEWWYFTGLLEAEDAPGRRFGYQLTFFRVGLAPDPPALDSAFAAGQAVMAHLAVTDLDAGAHVFSELVWRAAPVYGGFPADPGAPLAWALAPPGTPGRWSLGLDPAADGAFSLVARDDARAIALDVATRAARPVVLQGPNGYSRKSDREGYASSYYSYTRLDTHGVLALGGRTFRVRGTSWMDKEFGSAQLAPGQVGWDWWSLRLADGRDLMLYVLRRADGTADFRSATRVGRGGDVRSLAPGEWAVEPRGGTWRSPASGAAYPAGWRVTIPGESLVLDVQPLVAACENVSTLVPGLAYWEGPVRLLGPGGVSVGEGYVELAGYGAGSRPGI